MDSLEFDKLTPETSASILSGATEKTPRSGFAARCEEKLTHRPRRPTRACRDRGARTPVARSALIAETMSSTRTSGLPRRQRPHRPCECGRRASAAESFHAFYPFVEVCKSWIGSRSGREAAFGCNVKSRTRRSPPRVCGASRPHLSPSSSRTPLNASSSSSASLAATSSSTASSRCGHRTPRRQTAARRMRDDGAPSPARRGLLSRFAAGKACRRRVFHGGAPPSGGGADHLQQQQQQQQQQFAFIARRRRAARPARGRPS